MATAFKVATPLPSIDRAGRVAEPGPQQPMQTIHSMAISEPTIRPAVHIQYSPSTTHHEDPWASERPINPVNKKWYFVWVFLFCASGAGLIAANVVPASLRAKTAIDIIRG